MFILYRFLNVITVIVVTILLTACDDFGQVSEDTSRVNISGVWQYERVSWNEATSEFENSHFNVKLADDGTTVSLDHCTKNSTIIFNRSNDVLINNQGQKLRITDGNTVESISVPDLRKMTKKAIIQEAFNNAGTITIESNAFPTIDNSTSLCAQNIATTGSEKIHILATVPFEESQMDIELIVEDINEANYNVTQMTFESPSLRYYYQDDRTKLDTLYGNVTLHNLSSSNISLSFDITTAEFSTFPGETIQGSINFNF